MNPGPRECRNCKNSFDVLTQDIEFYEQMKVPAPTLCPDCRKVNRLLWRNFRALYRDNCDLCEKVLVSMYAPESPYAVYCRPCYYSDKWDGTDFARDYDFSKPFFQQFEELLKVAPRVALVQYGNPVDCTASSYTIDGKNLYMCYSALHDEDCAYLQSVDSSLNSYDCLDSKELELCYENYDATKNYRSQHMVHTRECVDSSFLYDCQNCQNCFMSSNLRNRQYVFRNKQLDKAGYEAEIGKLGLDKESSVAALKLEFRKMIEEALHKYADINRSPNSTGDRIDSSSDVRDSYDVNGSERVAYSDRVVSGGKDVHDISGGVSPELAYSGMGGSGAHNMRFYVLSKESRDTDYVDWCHEVHDLFGCVSLRNKSYCILNKQYSKEEYFELRSKIITDMTKRGEYGEFFPKELAPWAYNETTAHEFVPLTKTEALAQGFRWRDPETKDYVATILAKDLPDSIADVADTILKETIGCAHDATCNHSCTKAFRVIPAELAFYRDLGLPLPRLCPNCRHFERLTYRNPFHLWHRACMKPGCINEFESPYAPERPETVYCESCYQAEVV